MELNFFKIDDLWVAEFEVAGDFNLHIERANEGRMRIYQRTSGVKYKNVDATGWLDKILVYDSDFAGVVYPKTIKVESKSKPHVAIVTSESEIKQITPTLKFYLKGTECSFEQGMTWYNWCYSEYNKFSNGVFYIDETYGIMYYEGGTVRRKDGSAVDPYSYIIENHQYYAG